MGLKIQESVETINYIYHWILLYLEEKQWIQKHFIFQPVVAMSSLIPIKKLSNNSFKSQPSSFEDNRLHCKNPPPDLLPRQNLFIAHPYMAAYKKTTAEILHEYSRPILALSKWNWMICPQRQKAQKKDHPARVPLCFMPFPFSGVY